MNEQNTRISSLPTRTLLLLLLIATLIANGATLFNGFTYDDEYVVTRNYFIRRPANLLLFFTQQYFPLSMEMSYRPVVTLTYFADHALWGLRPFGFHATNLLLHLLCVFLVFALVLRLSNQRALAFLAALFFAINPVHAEAINAIGFREDLLAALFMFAALLLWTAWLHSRGSPLLLVGSLIAFLFALFSKENALVFPVLALSTHYLFPPKPSQFFQSLRQRLPAYALLGATTLFYLLVRFWLMPGVPQEEIVPIPRAPGALFLFFVKLLGHSLRLSLLPYPLRAGYDMQPLLRGMNSLFWIGCFAIVLIALWFSWARRQPLLMFSLLFFLISLLPVSNIVPLANPIAERYLYLPSFGVCLPLAFALLALARKVSPRLLFALVGIVAAPYVGLSIAQDFVWSSNVTLWSHALRYYPNDARALANLGVAYLETGDLAAAEDAARKALAVNPRYPLASLCLGTVLLRQNRPDEALAVLLRLASNPPARPDLAAVFWNNLGYAYDDLAQPDKAIESFQRALKYNPNLIDAYVNLGVAYAASGRIEDARKCWRSALKINPQDAPALHNLQLSEQR